MVGNGLQLQLVEEGVGDYRMERNLDNYFQTFDFQQETKDRIRIMPEASLQLAPPNELFCMECHW